jgi:exopolysaccharide production protein ExoZ
MVKQHLFTVDVVRFAAAILVTHFHLAYKAFADPADGLHYLLPTSENFSGATLGAFGWVGVQVFFVISGFVIAYSIKGETVLTYGRRRFLRLAPAVWLTVPICMLISVFAFHESLGAVVSNGFKAAIFFPLGPWIMGQFWTLPIEIVFYASVAGLIFFKQGERIEVFGVILGLASAAYWFADAVVHFSSYRQQIVRLLLVHHGIFFAFGIVVQRAGASGLTLLRLAFLGLMTVAAFLQINWASQWEAIGVDPTVRLWVPFLIWIALIGLVLASVIGRPPLEVPTKQRFAGVVKLLGLATYPLYLLHYHLGGLTLAFGLALGLSVNTSISLAISICVTASLVVAQFIEPRLRARIRKWSILRVGIE